MATKVSRSDRFILNTDYLALAKNNRYENNVIVPIIQLYDSSLDRYQKAGTATIDIKVPTPAGAIARSSVTYKGTGSYSEETTVSCGGYFTIIDQWWDGFVWQFYWYRKDSNTITIMVYVYQMRYYPAKTSTPSITFKLTTSYFYPPNI